MTDFFATKATQLLKMPAKDRQREMNSMEPRQRAMIQTEIDRLRREAQDQDLDAPAAVSK